MAKGRQSNGPKKTEDAASKLQRMLENPFEKVANHRPKHEVVNRRTKGANKNVAKARLQSVESRRSTLMQEYQKTKKANTFEDRRFGEKDSSLSADQKMLVRFRTERIKRARKASKYNLDEAGPEEILTHKGQALNLDDYDDDSKFQHASDDEEDGELQREIVDQLHFGGGYGSGPTDGARRKSKAETLEEIIQRSKLAKMERSEQKDQQEDQRQKLDQSFEQLVFAKEVAFKPTKREQTDDILKRLLNKRKRTDESEKDKDTPAEPEEELDDYDQLITDMVFDARLQASDRTKTPEEIAKEERERLEELERERLARMRASARDEDEEADGAFGSAKKQRHRTDDDLDDDDDIADGRAHSQDPSEAAAGVSSNWGFFGSDEDDDDDEDDDEDEDDEDDDDEDDDDEDDDDEDDGDDEDGDDDDEEDGEEESKAAISKRPRDVASDEESDEDEDEEEDDDEEDEEDEEEKQSNDAQEAKAAASKKALAAQIAASTPKEHDDIPYLFECPSNPEQLDEWLSTYGSTAERINIVLDRIKKSNSIHLSERNKHGMHNFYDMLLKRFIVIGDQLAAVGPGGTMDRQLQLDFMSGLIFDISQEMPDVAVSIWGRLLLMLHERVEKRLRDYAIGEKERCWPSTGTLLLLKLQSLLFSVTDYRHVVVTPTLLLLGQCLTHCPVNTLADLRAGLFCAVLMIDICSKAKRYAPEAILFLKSLLVVFLSPTQRAKFSSQILPSFSYDSLQHIREGLSSFDASTIETDFASLKVPLRKLEDDALTDSSQSYHAACVLATALRFIRTILRTFHDFISLPELSECFVSMLAVLATTAPAGVREATIELLESIIKQSDDVRRQRGPLQWRRKEKATLNMVAPKFDENYAPKKDAALPKHKKEEKSLMRKIKREKKAAMRELRRDAEFVEQERWKARNAKIESVKKDIRQNMNWLQEQQATLKQQVKQGKGLLKGGGSFVKKRARVKA